MSTWRQSRASTSRSGARALVRSAAAFSMAAVYSGVSSSRLRMYRARPKSTAETRNGTRHAQPSSTSLPSEETAKKAKVASAMPAGGVESTREV